MATYGLQDLPTTTPPSSDPLQDPGSTSPYGNAPPIAPSPMTPGLYDMGNSYQQVGYAPPVTSYANQTTPPNTAGTNTGLRDFPPAAATTTTTTNGNQQSPPSAAPPAGFDWTKYLQQDNTVGLAAIDAQKQWQNYLMTQYLPAEQALQQKIQEAAATGKWGDVQTLQAQLQQFQEQMQTQQQYINSITEMGNLTGMVGGKETLPFQQLQNQMALQGGQLNLGARAQDLQALQSGQQYDTGLRNIFGQGATAFGQQALGGLNAATGYATNYQNALAGYGNQFGQQALGGLNAATGYATNYQNQLGSQNAALGNNNQNILGAEGQYALGMQQAQNQLAQSPLVAWYTARGLAPPQSAIQTNATAAPDWSKYLDQNASNQQQFTNALLQQRGAPGTVPGFNDFIQNAQGGQNQILASLQSQQGAPGTVPGFNQFIGQAQGLQNQFAGAALNPSQNAGGLARTGLAPWQSPQMRWDTSAVQTPAPPGVTPVGVNQGKQQWTSVNDPQGLYNGLMQGYKQWQQQNPGQPWDESTFTGVAAMNGIPQGAAHDMWMQAQQQPGGRMNEQIFMGILNSAYNNYNQGQGPAPVQDQQWMPRSA